MPERVQVFALSASGASTFLHQVLFRVSIAIIVYLREASSSANWINVAGRLSPYFPLYPAAFHRGRSPRLEGGYRGCRLCPTGVKIKAAISQCAREAVFYGGGLLWNRTPILDGFAPSFYNPVANHKRPPDSVRVAASYPPPPQTRFCTLNKVSRVESISKIAIRGTFF